MGFRLHPRALFWGIVACLTLAPLYSVRAAPILSPFPSITAVEGALYFGVVDLDSLVSDPAYSVQELAWNCATSSDLVVYITDRRHLVISPPDSNWFGAAEVLVTVTNPAGECATQAVSVCVDGLPDVPVIEWIPDQVTSRGRAFAPLGLSEYGWDPDGSDGLSWQVAPGSHLVARLDGQTLVVSAEDPDWVGTESLTLTLSDPTGRNAQCSVPFTVTETPSVTLIALGGEGFLIEGSGKRVVIDALVRQGLPYTESERSRLRHAVAPFDGVVIALTSHRHYDHFDAEYAADFLASSPGTVFASGEDAVGDLRRLPRYAAIADRVLEIPFVDGARTEFEIEGIHITAFHLRHVVSGSTNLAFLIDVDGVRILHLGDASPFDYSAEDLGRVFGALPLRVDVLLASSYRWFEFPSCLDLVSRAIAPRFAVPMHLPGLCPFSYTVYAPVEGMDWVKLCAKGRTWVVPRQQAAGS